MAPHPGWAQNTAMVISDAPDAWADIHHTNKNRDHIDYPTRDLIRHGRKYMAVSDAVFFV
jgi:hypothetical protein